MTEQKDVLAQRSFACKTCGALYSHEPDCPSPAGCSGVVSETELQALRDSAVQSAKTCNSYLERALRAEALVEEASRRVEPCKGEHSNFEEWAAAERYDMQVHPIHYLFADPKTYAARQGWKAALRYVASSLTSTNRRSDALQALADIDRDLTGDTNPSTVGQPND